MTCSNIQPQLQAYLDGETDDTVRAQLSTHLQDCAACRKELSELREFDQFLREIDDLYGEAPGLHVPYGFAQRIVARAQSQPPAAAKTNRWLVWQWFVGFSVPIRLAVISALLLATLGGLRAGQVITDLITRSSSKPLPSVNIDMTPAEQSLVLLMRGDGVLAGPPNSYNRANKSRDQHRTSEDNQ